MTDPALCPECNSTLARSVALALKQENEQLKVELETLRGIAKRLADGWMPTILWTSPKTYCFEWTNDEGEDDPMAPAEVHAIYGTGKESE